MEEEVHQTDGDERTEGEVTGDRHQGHLDGQWDTASHLELGGRAKGGRASRVDLRKALENPLVGNRLADRTGRCGKGRGKATACP